MLTATGKASLCEDIFDQDAYQKTFSEFSPPLAEVGEPVLSAAFTQDGTGLNILYLSGEDLHEETQRFVLG